MIKAEAPGPSAAKTQRVQDAMPSHSGDAEGTENPTAGEQSPDHTGDHGGADTFTARGRDRGRGNKKSSDRGGGHGRPTGDAVKVNGEKAAASRSDGSGAVQNIEDKDDQPKACDSSNHVQTLAGLNLKKQSELVFKPPPVDKKE